MKIIISLLLLLPLLSCDKEFLDESVQRVKKEKKFIQPLYPFIVDSYSKVKKIFKYQIELEKGNYNPLYIGPVNDTLTLDYNSKFDEYFLYESQQHFPYWKDEHLKISIEIDTAHIIGNRVRVWVHEEQGFSLKEFLCKAYPVHITNHSFETYFIGYGEHIPMILEAKNKLGQWKAIERPYRYSCGNGLNTIIIPSKYLLVTSVPLFEGNFQTELRLKLGNYYSAPFTGKIFQSQFQNEYDQPIY